MSRSAAIALVVLAAAMQEPAIAQSTPQIVVPGSAFDPEYAPAVQVANVADGRSFRGKAFAKIALRTSLPMPGPGNREYSLRKLAIQFRTSNPGVSLRLIELARTRSGRLQKIVNISRSDGRRAGDNVWDFGTLPARVDKNAVLRLEVQFPGGIDSEIDPGAFIITSAVLDFTAP